MITRVKVTPQKIRFLNVDLDTSQVKFVYAIRRLTERNEALRNPPDTREQLIADFEQLARRMTSGKFGRLSKPLFRRILQVDGKDEQDIHALAKAVFRPATRQERKNVSRIAIKAKIRS
jgi:hypothetical protein